jgi:hypothetical protein
VYLIYLPRYTLPHTGLRGEVDIDFSMTAHEAISVLASLQLESFIEGLALLKVLVCLLLIWWKSRAGSLTRSQRMPNGNQDQSARQA